MKSVIAALVLAAWIHAAIPTADTVTNTMGMKFKRIPAGTFQMGYEGGPLPSAADIGNLRYGLYDEYPAHDVTFSSDFYMGVYEVMNRQFKQFRPSHGTGISWYQGGDSVPATSLTWYAADSFCRWMTANDPDGWTYRLPTEAEWEYCLRAGTTTPFYSGDTLTAAEANVGCYGSYCSQLKKAGTYPPNPFGLYDMLHNAKEWCLDWYGPYSGLPQTDPGGYDASEYKVWRGANADWLFLLRSAARGGAVAGDHSQGILLGFRVVISNVNPVISSQPDTVNPHARGIAAARPAPDPVVNGESYVDADGRAFVRASITRGNGRYPVQKDSVVYVSLTSISGDSGSERRLAGLYAERISRQYGILYRLSNRYELADAGIVVQQGRYHLTLLPDVKYPEGCFTHPDMSYYVNRTAPMMPTLPDSLNLGYVNYQCNHFSHIAECPNGDILANWYSGVSEDGRDLNQAGTRLRLGSTQWDSVTQLSGIPLIGDEWAEFWNDGKGNLFRYVVNWEASCAYVSVSRDNGAHWNDSWLNPNVGPQHSIYRMGGDTVVAPAEANVVAVNGLAVSLDGGRTWSLSNRPFSGNGYHISGALFDDRSFMIFLRGATVKNSDSIPTCFSALTRDLGTTWQPLPTPFYPPNIGQYNAALRLQSGRLLFALHCNVPGKGGVILAESEDDGKNWFCRRKFGTSAGGNGDDMRGYLSLCQGKDGVIHLQGTKGSGGGLNGQLPQASFSEQWLREGTCLDISDWGINTAGMVASGCPADDALPPLGVNGAAAKVGAALVAAPTLLAAPNPFNPSVRFYITAGNENVMLKIFDCSGKMVADLPVDGKQGRIVEWNAGNKASGLYFAVLECGAGRLVKAVVLAR